MLGTPCIKTFLVCNVIVEKRVGSLGDIADAYCISMHLILVWCVCWCLVSLDDQR